MKRIHKFEYVLKYFSPDIRKALEKISVPDREKVHEIRLRVGKPIAVTSFGKEKYLIPNGSFSENERMAMVCTAEDINYSFKAICDYSVYSYEKQICNGYITIQGGYRVGISGSASYRRNHIETLKYINGLNFRIAGQVDGCAERIYKEVLCNAPKGLIIAGSPSSGKTTIIKDLCRLMGSRWRVSIIDERGEISATLHGEPQNNVGLKSDIFDGYPKAEGIETAIRVMTPDIVVCDEIGSRKDTKALIGSVNSGVKIIATAHAGSIEELKSRKHIKKLLKCGVFEYAVLLGNESEVGQVKELVKL